MDVEMTDLAGNYELGYLYNRYDSSSYSFLTYPEPHLYVEHKYVKSQKINVTYQRVGDPLAVSELIKIIDEPGSPPEDNLTLDLYFTLSLDPLVSYVHLTLSYDIRESTPNPSLYGKDIRGLCDLDDMLFYALVDGAWEPLVTKHPGDDEIEYVWDISAGYELTMGVFLKNLDWDDDGVRNDLDIFPRDKDEWCDEDLDGYGDNYEDAFPANSSYWLDTDDDGMPDEWELLFGLDPFDDDDGYKDLDGDGLTNREEFEKELYPNDYDYDGDGMPDGWEVKYGLDFKNGSDGGADPDGDGTSNYQEFLQGRDPVFFDPPSENADGKKTNYTALALVILTLLVLSSLTVYTLVARRRKMAKALREHKKYFDLEELGEIEYPNAGDWIGQQIGGGSEEPLEVFDLDYLKELGITDGANMYGGKLFDLSHASLFRPGARRKKPLLDEDEVFSGPQFECGSCGEEVEMEDEICPYCDLEFDEGLDFKGDLDEEELKELLENVNIFACSNCQEEVNAEDKKCPDCGAFFLEEGQMMCSNCKTAVEGDAVKCENCGSEFE